MKSEFRKHDLPLYVYESPQYSVWKFKIYITIIIWYNNDYAYLRRMIKTIKHAPPPVSV